MLKLEDFFYMLSDETRLRCLLLLQAKGECCVCDFTHALQKMQPKISRHLAILRGSRIVLDRRAGAWIYYSIHPDLPTWVSHLLFTITTETAELYAEDLLRLNERDRTMCEKALEAKKNESDKNSPAFQNILPPSLLANA
ncbi:MAG: metalloregulator ArsR/SmtB family transcription factor [Gammaproteobacteria bacterium]|nr:metalloregulator ArsR/SmtB family transcription factor [Gammaproteobacteria bacterium]